MGKKPVDSQWFDFFPDLCLKESLEWLEQFSADVEKIANFGCWTGSEPFGLLWTLDATEVVVVEKEEKDHLDKAREYYKRLQEQVPQRLEGRSVTFLLADMTLEIPELQSEYFDLAYCDRVLYNMKTDDSLKAAINQMVRCVKPGGLVIAIEPMVGGEYEEVVETIGTFRRKSFREIAPAKDISPLFEEQRLSRVHPTVSTDFWVYCYRKSKLDSY